MQYKIKLHKIQTDFLNYRKFNLLSNLSSIYPI